MQLDQIGLVVSGLVAVPQSWVLAATSCGCQLPLLGLKNQAKLDLKTLSATHGMAAVDVQVVLLVWATCEIVSAKCVVTVVVCIIVVSLGWQTYILTSFFSPF